MFDQENITPEWLTSVLRNNGFIEQETITNVHITRTIKRHSSLYFFDIAPSNVVVLDIISRSMMLKVEKLGNERSFYRIMKDITIDLPIPQCYNLNELEQKECHYLLLDDLSKTHEEAGKIIPSSKFQCEMAIKSLAKIHATFWDHSNLDKIVPHKNIMAYTVLAFKKKIPRILKSVFEFLEDRISEERRKIYRMVSSQFPDIKLHRLNLKKHLTLTHGDAWLGNFLFPKQNNYDPYNANHQAYIIDWETWSAGFGPNDLAHMIGLNWHPKRRKCLEKDLVKQYHKELAKYGIQDYSWEDCWYDYRLGIIGELLTPIIWCYWKFHPDIWLHTLEYSYQSFKDLKCLDLIKEGRL